MRKLLLTAVAAAALSAAPAANAAITFAGGSTGCFQDNGVGPCTATDGGLTFIGGPATFNQTTDSTGFAGIGGPTNNFGTITLLPDGTSYNGDVFNLVISFTAPPGSGPGSFTANLLGSLVSNGVGGVNIAFTNGTQTLGSSSIGPFVLHVNDVSFSGSLGPNETVLRQDISGYIQAAVPEPGTWAMMLLGFGGIGMAMRRRRQPALAQIA